MIARTVQGFNNSCHSTANITTCKALRVEIATYPTSGENRLIVDLKSELLQLVCTLAKLSGVGERLINEQPYGLFVNKLRSAQQRIPYSFHAQNPTAR